MLDSKNSCDRADVPESFFGGSEEKRDVLTLQRATEPDYRSCGQVRCRVRRLSVVTLATFGAVVAPALMLAQPRRATEVSAKSTTAITGYVVEGPGRSPVVGARVLSVAEPRDRGDSGRRSSTTTDSRGFFSLLTGLESGSYDVLVSFAGYRGQRRRGVRVGEQLAFSLARVPSIVGQVTDPEGRPLSNATVFLEHTALGATRGRQIAAGANGQFVSADLASGRYRLLAYALGLAPSRLVGVTVSDGWERVTLQLRRGFRVTGKLRNNRREPLVAHGGFLQLNDEPCPPAFIKHMRLHASGGAFSASDVPPGRHQLLVSADGYSPRSLIVAVQDRDVSLGNVTLRQGHTIRGVVRDAAGAAVGGCEIIAELSGQPIMIAVSKGDGTFLLGVREAAVHDLVAGCPQGEARLRTMTDGSPVVLTLRSQGRIEGHVVDEEENPVAEFWIAMSSERQGGLQPVRRHESHFVLEHVSPASYSILVEAAGFVPRRLSDVVVAESETTDIGMVILRRGLAVEGSVKTPLGSPIVGAAVVAISRSGLALPDSRAFTDRRGHFVLSGIPSGTADLVARHRDYADAYASGVVVEASSAPPPVEMVMSAGGGVAGRLLRRRPRPLIRQLVATAECVGQCVDRAPRLYSSPIEAGGDFLLEHLPPGRFRIAVRSALVLEGPPEGPAAEVEVREGETASVLLQDAAILVRGRVSRRGSPLPGVRVVFSVPGEPAVPVSPAAEPGSTEPRPLAAVTDTTGAFALKVDAPGSYAAYVSGIGSTWQLPPRRVEVPDGEGSYLDLDFKVARVAGRVFDSSTGNPIAEARIRAGTASCRSDTTGAFECYFLAGKYLVRATAAGIGEGSRQLEVTSLDQEDVDIEIQRGTALRGRVVGAAGEPMPRVAVSAKARNGGSAVTTETAEDGTFVLEGLSAPSYNLFGMGRSLVPSCFYSINVSPAATQGLLEVRANPCVVVQFRIVKGDETPIGRATVSLSRIGGASVTAIGLGISDGTGHVAVYAPSSNATFLVLDPEGKGRTIDIDLHNEVDRLITVKLHN